MHRAFGLAFLLLALGLVMSSTTAARRAIAADTSTQVIAQFTLNPQREPNLGTIEKIEADGRMRVATGANAPGGARGLSEEPREGYYVGVVVTKLGGPKLQDARLVRVQVTDIEADGILQALVGKNLQTKIKPGEVLMFFRPPGALTAQLKAVPDLVPLAEGLPPASAAPADPKALQQAHLTQSLVNLKQIGLAMHNFHSTYNSFPPAVIRGPDGKPWHSWRVLLLPYLEERELYAKYRFDEPWDGPNNSKLLDQMPTVYADPIYGENQDHLTHYAAITGPGMAFSAEGPQFDGKKPNLGQGVRIAKVSDGLSNTLLVGPIAPGEKIPWMKPQDLVINDKFPLPGNPGSFALAYKLPQGDCGPFLVSDGSVQLLPKPKDLATLRGLLTIDGREVNDGTLLGVIPLPIADGGTGRPVPTIYVLREGETTTARLVMPQRGGRPPRAGAPR